MDPRIATHVRSSYLWLLAWSLLWIVAPFTGTPPSSHSLLWVHFAMGGIGFAGNLVLGVGHRLAANFTGHDLPPRGYRAAETGAVSLAAALVAMASQPYGGVPELVRVAADWSLATCSLALAAAAWRQIRNHPPGLPQSVCAGGPGDLPSFHLLMTAVAYFVLAGLLAPWQGATNPIVVHLWLVGGVTTTIFMVAHRVLPRFSRMQPRPRLHRVQAFAAIPGPALVALGIHFSWTPWSALGGLLEFTAATLFSVLAVLALRTRRGNQPAVPAFVTASLFLLAGMGLGIHFLNHPEMRIHTPVHAINNLLGFVGMTVVGLGATMLGTGIRPVPGQVHRDVWRVAVPWFIFLVAWEVTTYLDWPGKTLLASLLGLVLALHAMQGLQAAARIARPSASPSLARP